MSHCRPDVTGDPIQVLVTDGDQRPALAIVRTLGRRGIRVLVGADRPCSLASSSRYCHRHVTYPSPYVSRKAFDHFLLDFVRRERVGVLIPVTDVTMEAVCANQAELKRHCALTVPPAEAFELVTDKARLLQAAAGCGIPVPRTRVIGGPADLKTAIDGLRYPVVVKPFRSRIRTPRGWVAAGVHYARSERDLWRLYRKIAYLASCPSLIQERIIGPGIGVFTLFDRGRLLTAFAHRRLREKPPAGGVSVLSESIALAPGLREHAIRLLGAIGWHGVAMLEFKQDLHRGTCFLMEVNGRFWGSLQLAIDAGVDFPHLACELALGRTPAPPPRYKVGVRSRWLLGDFDQLLLRLFKSGRDLDLPEAAPSRLRAVLDFFMARGPRLRNDVARLDDPRPFLYELRRTATELAASAARRARFVAGAERHPCSQPQGEYESHELAG
jgi:predicted ATP-grasp superfamily ATP-dependent carboligase